MISTAETLSDGRSVDEKLAQLVSDAEGTECDALAKEIELLATGAKIKAEIEGLWRIYSGRRAGATYQWAGETIEERMLATRYPDMIGIEETYCLEDRYSPDLKHGWAQRASVLITTGNGQWRIVVDEADRYEVMHRDSKAQSWTHVEDKDEVKSCVEDFQHRSLIAAETHKGRSHEEKSAADMNALAQLMMLAPHLARKATTTE